MNAADARTRALRMVWRRRLLAIAGIGLLAASPLVGPFVGQNFVLGWTLCSAIVGLSMNVLAGYAGQISLAHAVLYGSGAFAMGNLVTRAEVPWIISLPVSGLITAAIALLIGFPALRIRGLNLAIATLGFQFAMQRVVFRAQFLTGGAAGIDIEPLFGDSPTAERDFVWVIIAALIVIVLIDRNLTRSKLGRSFFAVRQDEQVAASFGIPVAQTKLMAFALSGFYAGIAGALFGTLQGDVTNELFDYIFSIEFLVFAVLGGLGSRTGTAVGAAFPIVYRRMLEFLRTTGPMLGGMLLVITLIRYAGGMAAQGRELLHIAGQMRRAGWRYLGLFFAALAGSIAAGIAAMFLVGRVAEFVLGLVFNYRWSTFPAALVLLGTIAVTFQLLVRQVAHLAARAGRFTPAHAPAQVATSTQPVALTEAVEALRPRTDRKPYAGALLQVENLAIRFGGVRALDGVSMEVRAGELIGIMGPNGSGKTTMLNNISGFLTPNEGDIRFRGKSILGMAPHQRSALGIGRTFQNVGLVKQETVFDNFIIAQHLACQYGPLEGLLRTGAVVSEERRLRARAEVAIDLLGLRDIVATQVRSLPHGRAKLVELGCALVSGPELLLLDEPAAGVSPQEADALGQSLKEIADRFGVTILMIEHHVPLMLSTCDYIYVLNFGRLLTHGAPLEVARHPDVIAAYLGTAGKEASLAPA